MPGIAEQTLLARDTTLTIMTTSLEMLQIKPFDSKRYPILSCLPSIYSLNSCSELYLVGTCRRHFIIQAMRIGFMNMLMRPTTTTYQSRHHAGTKSRHSGAETKNILSPAALGKHTPQKYNYVNYELIIVHQYTQYSLIIHGTRSWVMG